MFLWFMGPTALLVTTIIVVVFLGMSDYIKVTISASTPLNTIALV